MPAHLGEDKVLLRLLGECSNGFYIDVGANDPLTSSNTHSFYLKGWRGIDIEPIPELAAKLRAEHSENIVLECAVGAVGCRATLYKPQNLELSTLRADIATGHIKQGFGGFEPVDVEVRTLDSILAEFASRPIDFISMDVEGSEAWALAGLDLRAWQPRVLLIEATLPNTRIPAWDQWEPGVLASGYELAEFDGYNRFYTRRPLGTNS